jgi:hypothetical protein
VVRRSAARLWRRGGAKIAIAVKFFMTPSHGKEENIQHSAILRIPGSRNASSLGLVNGDAHPFVSHAAAIERGFFSGRVSSNPTFCEQRPINDSDHGD